jgi:hypothetical protein
MDLYWRPRCEITKQFTYYVNEFVDLEETERSLILNRHLSPGENVITRLGLHAGNSIPA